MVIARLRQYVSERQRECNLYMQPLTYAYSTPVHRSTTESPFSIVFSCHPLAPTTFNIPKLSPTDVTATTTLHALRPQLLDGLAAMQQDMHKRMKSAPMSFLLDNTSDLDRPLMINSATERLAIESYSKPMPCEIGQFKVVQVSLDD